VAILAGERHASTGADRTRGFTRYFREQGITLRPEWTLNGPFDSLTGHQQGEYLLGLTRGPQAFFAVNDFLAIGLMGAARDKGLMPGKDIAVVGFNDIPLANELMRSPDQRASAAGRHGPHAVELLLKRIKGEACRVDCADAAAAGAGEFVFVALTSKMWERACPRFSGGPVTLFDDRYTAIAGKPAPTFDGWCGQNAVPGQDPLWERACSRRRWFSH
jgi:ABC-type sugar transport system substrate-binding protein